MRTMILLLAVLAATFLARPGAIAGQLYKWVDEEGKVHYSDTPVEGAEPVELPPPASYDMPVPPSRPLPRTEPEPAEEETVSYDDFEFVSPKQDQVFWATGGEIPVYLDIQPSLMPGHRLNLYFNGELTESSPLAGPGTTLLDVYRGAHTVRAAIVDSNSREIASAGPVTFHVKQHSIQNPQRRSNR